MTAIQKWCPRLHLIHTGLNAAKPLLGEKQEGSKRQGFRRLGSTTRCIACGIGAGLHHLVINAGALLCDSSGALEIANETRQLTERPQGENATHIPMTMRE